MNIAEGERKKVAEWTGTNLYARSKQQVLESVEVEVIGSMRASDQTALDLAYQAGMARSFRELEKLGIPAAEKHGPIMPHALTKHKTPDTPENQ